VLTKPQLARYVHSSGLNDPGFAENEVVLTYLLQLLVERGFIERVVFKGGTCIRKMLLGNRGRFSTDLDFTAPTLYRLAILGLFFYPLELRTPAAFPRKR
jgi:predicted nucleotidyltransferase component of viral defense system